MAYEGIRSGGFRDGGRGGRDGGRDNNKRSHGGWDGDRYLQGGRGPRDNTPRPTECEVMTNHNKLDVLKDPLNLEGPCDYDIFRFKVELKNVRSIAVKDPETGADAVNFEEHEMRADEKSKKFFFSGPMPWRVIKKILTEQRENDSNFILDVSAFDNALIQSVIYFDKIQRCFISFVSV